MNLERIIQILKNREFVKVKEDELSLIHWYDVTTYNGGQIRIEQLLPFSYLFNNKCIYRIYLFVPEEEKAIEYWSIDRKSKLYDVVENIYYSLDSVKNNNYSKYF